MMSPGHKHGPCLDEAAVVASQAPSFSSSFLLPFTLILRSLQNMMPQDRFQEAVRSGESTFPPLASMYSRQDTVFSNPRHPCWEMKDWAFNSTTSTKVSVCPPCLEYMQSDCITCPGVSRSLMKLGNDRDAPHGKLAPKQQGVPPTDPQ